MVKTRLARHVTEKASQRFKTTIACTLFCADLLFALFGVGLFAFAYARRPESGLVFSAEIWLWFELSSALLVVLAIATFCGWCFRIVRHDRTQRQFSSGVDNPSPRFALWWNRWDSRDNWLLWAHGVSLFILMVGVLVGLMFVTSVDQAVFQSTKSDFRENSTAPTSYVQQVVLKYMQRQTDRMFSGEDTAGEGECLFSYSDTSNATLLNTSHGLSLYTNDSFAALSAPLVCPGTERIWFNNFVNDKCASDAHSNDTVLENCAVALHCTDSSSGGGNGTRRGAGAACVYCRCRARLVEAVHAYCLVLFVALLCFSACALMLALMAASLAATRHAGRRERSWTIERVAKTMLRSTWDYAKLWGGCVLSYVDLITDVLVTRTYYEQGEYQWAGLAATFLIVPALCTAAMNFFDVPSNKVGALRAITFSEMAWQTVVSSREGMKTVYYQHARVAECGLEAIPQSVLQLFTLFANWENIASASKSLSGGSADAAAASPSSSSPSSSWAPHVTARLSDRSLLIFSIAISVVSAALCYMAFLSEAYMNEVDKSHFMFRAARIRPYWTMLPQALYAVTDISLHVFVWALTAVALGGWVWLALALAGAERAWFIRRYKLMPEKPLSATVAMLTLMDFPTSSTKRISDQDATIAENGQLRVVVQGDVSNTELLNKLMLLTLADQAGLLAMAFVSPLYPLPDQLQEGWFALLAMVLCLWMLKIFSYRLVVALSHTAFGWKDRVDRSTEKRGRKFADQKHLAKAEGSSHRMSDSTSFVSQNPLAIGDIGTTAATTPQFGATGSSGSMLPADSNTTLVRAGSGASRVPRRKVQFQQDGAGAAEERSRATSVNPLNSSAAHVV